MAEHLSHKLKMKQNFKKLFCQIYLEVVTGKGHAQNMIKMTKKNSSRECL